MSAMAMFRQLSSVRCAAAAASRSLLALPYSICAAALTDEQLVYGCPTVLARVLAPAASRGFLDAFTAYRARLFVVSHRFPGQRA